MVVRKRTSYKIKSKVEVGLCLQLVFALIRILLSYQRKVGEEQLDELIDEFYVK